LRRVKAGPAMLSNVQPVTLSVEATAEPSTAAVLAVVALPFIGAAATPLVYRWLDERTSYVAAGVAAVCVGLVASQVGTKGAVSVTWIPSLDVALRFYVDGLALLVAFLASGVGVLILTYSRAYMRGKSGQPRYYATLLAFMGSMLGVALAADLVALFVFWELTSISSFLLIGHHYRTDDSQYAARKSMLVTVAGGLFMLAGFLVLHAVAADVHAVESTYRLAGEGSLLANADAVQAALEQRGLLVPVLLLVGVGAAAKSAQLPLHFWLPDAMEAPTPVSAFLHSATMVKAGVYLVGRLRPLLASGEWTLLFALLGLVTMTVTAMLAVAATDIKELLAYSTASHLGLIVAGFGITAALGGKKAGVIGAETGAFHVLNHALFKAALFLVAGIVAHEAGTRAIDELGGLAEDLPWTAAVTVVAGLGMAGVPPFNGFYSKELLFEATWEAAVHAGGLWWLLPVVAVFGSVFTVIYSLRFVLLFFGEKPDQLGDVHAPAGVMLGPPVLLGGLAALVGLGGVTATVGVHLEPLEAFVSSVAASTAPAGAEVHFGYHLPTSPRPAVLMSALTVVVGLAGYARFAAVRDAIRAVLAVDPLRADWWYDEGVLGTEVAGTRLATAVHTGLVRTYAAWVLGTISVLALSAYLAAGVGLPGDAGIAVSTGTVVVLVVAIGAAAAVSRAPSHVAGVLSLSILGFMVAIFYILANAPDLALTQLVVETLVLVIFLLVLDKLPPFYGEATTGRVLRDGVLSLAVGATVMLTVLTSTQGTPDSPLATFFVERAGIPEEHGSLVVDYGGGHNVVNVILVDFRAFDTLGEITVIALAAVSVLTLIAMRKRGETQ
jgi:multicomponent Na+:H+ antiporter subunit A